MQGVFQASYPASPYFDKILSMMAQSNIQQLNFCIKKCNVLQNLNEDSLNIQDKVCIDRCASRISFDVQIQRE